MSNEFDDVELPVHRRSAAAADAAPLWHERTVRLLARLVHRADGERRARALVFLLRPLSTLSLAAVAAGAFGGYIHRPLTGDASVVLMDAANYTRDQILALVRFALEVNPEVVAQVSELLADNPAGMAAFGATALLVLHRHLRPATPATPRPGDR